MSRDGKTRSAVLGLLSDGRWAWAGAFAAMAATHAAVVFVPAELLWLDIVVTILALAAALSFTAWYPAYVRKKTELS
jgi:hypothetical protein